MKPDAIEIAARAKYNRDVREGLRLPSVFENDGQDEPKDERLWARVAPQMGDSYQADMCQNPRLRHPGVLLVCLFFELNQGTKDVMAMAAEIVELFQPQVDAGVTYKQPSIKKLGNQGKGWFQVNVTCPFYADGFAEE